MKVLMNWRRIWTYVFKMHRLTMSPAQCFTRYLYEQCMGSTNSCYLDIVIKIIYTKVMRANFDKFRRNSAKSSEKQGNFEGHET